VRRDEMRGMGGKREEGGIGINGGKGKNEIVMVRN
jgi:hypothetical protein